MFRLHAIAAAVTVLAASAAAAPAPAPSLAEILAASPASDWRTVDPTRTLYVELPAGRVIIELAPGFAPKHAANIEKLAQAGYRGPQPVTTFYFFRFIAPFTLAAATAFYLFVVNGFGLATMAKLCICMIGLVLGYYAPNLYISNVASKRRESIVAGFPDALDLLLICVESGMSIEAALQKVSQEVGASSIELAEELSLLVAELSYLPDRIQAYQGLAKRTNHPGVKSVATAMVQAERYGTPLGGALRIMAKENRELRMSAAEKIAAALPAKLTVPMIVFFLPVLFVFVLGPAIIKVQDAMAPK